MQPGGFAPGAVPGHAGVLRHRLAAASRHPAADSADPAGDQDRRLRPAGRHRYATNITDAETGERVDVLPDREAATLTTWLPGKNNVEVVCRDGSATYAEATRRALPKAAQVSDRWHLRKTGATRP
jgi:transposase